jgi:hypothetical protein
MPGARHYCPSYGSCAYAVLHDSADCIFAIAYGMCDIAFRLPANVVAAALRAGDGRASDIGADWLVLPAFPPGGPTAASEAALRARSAAALRYAAELSSSG